MSSDWSKGTVGEVATFENRRRIPLSATQRVHRQGSYPYWGANGILDYVDDYLFDGTRILVGEDGTVRTGDGHPVVHWVRGRFWVNNHAHVLWTKSSACDPRWLHYALRNASVDPFITGAAQPKLSMRQLQRVPLLIPPLEVQRRIASVLGAFDELIEIDERRIELLEGLARSLYREWFVHFRFPGYEEIRLVDSDMGPIPRGWEIGSIEDVAPDPVRGIAPKYAEDGFWTVINQRCIRNQRVDLSPSRRHGGKVSDGKRVRYADVLINSTGVGTLGRVAMFLEETDAITADSHVTIVRAKSPESHPWLGLHMLSREAEFQSMGTGSTGQTELGRSAVGALSVLIPPKQLMQAFAEFTWPLLRPIPTIAHESRVLARTRDLLLPRLVTGRLDVSKIDEGQLTAAEVE